METILLNVATSAIKWIKSNLAASGDSDVSRDIIQIIESRGFKAETHYVTTEDGHILTLFRIVNPFANTFAPKAVLLQHGLGAHSAHWVINSDDGYAKTPTRTDPVENTLAFALSNRGYDVWLSNSRGSKYSTGHKTMDADKDPMYWDFSFDEMVEFDVPSTIDYVLQQTKQATLAYVGLSQGNTIMFALLSEKPQYSQIVKPFIALAPVTRINNFPLPLPRAVKKHALDAFGTAFKYYPGPALDFTFANVIKSLLTGNQLTKYYFELNARVDSLMGFSKTNTKRLEIYTAHCGIHLSRKNIVHYCQLITDNTFHKFDFGEAKNRKLYGNERAPEYPLENINSKHVALIYSEDDWFLTVKDVNFIKNKLTVPLFEEFVIKGYNHFDFTFGKDCGEQINSKVVRILDKALVDI